MLKVSDFYGYWFIETRSSIYFETTFMIIDKENIRFYLGPVNYTRVNSYYDTQLTYLGIDPYFQDPYEIIGDELYIGSGYWICSFVKGNKNRLQFTTYNGGFGFPFKEKPYVSAVYFKRISEIPKTLVQSRDFPNAINWNNPKLLLNYWISHFKCSYNLVPHSGTNYFTVKRFNEIAKIFLDGSKGVLRKACIQWIYKSTNIPISYKPVIILGDMSQTAPTISYYGTVLFISKYSKITSSNKVTISGYKGEWAVINGEWNIDPYTYSNSVTYPSDRAFTCSNRRYIIIPFDSRNLPEYNPIKHGSGEIRSYHKSINEKSSYRDMIVALEELIFSTGFSTHTRGFYIALVKDVNKPPIVPETYKEIQDLLDTNPSYVVNIRFRSRHFVQCNGSMYINPDVYNISYQSFDINNPFQIDYTLNYNIVISNYLLEGSVKTIYYKETPDGEFVFIVGDIGAIPPGYNSLNSQVIFGYVNESRTNGNRVGYIYFPDYAFTVQFGSIFSGIPGNQNYYVYLLIGTIMNYLITTYQIQDVIFDNRGNGGGSVTLCYTVACSVGGKRNYFNQSVDPNRNPCNPVMYKTNYPYIDPAEMEKVIPNSVLRGTPQRRANVIIMTDLNAGSAGDIFPNQFNGDKIDGELGDNTKAFIIGNIDGRLSGGVLTALFPPVKTPDEAGIHYSNETSGKYAIPPFSFANDTIGSFLYAGTQNSISYFQKETNPVVLIPHDFSVTYSDMGYLPPTIKYLNNVQPDKNDPTTWQDSYFENAIRIIRKCKPAIPKAYKYVQIGNDKPVTFCQKVYQYETPRKYVLVDQYPQKKNAQNQSDQANTVDKSSNQETNTPKCVKCSNVVVNTSGISQKNILTTQKYFSEKTYMDNLTALDKEFWKDSSILPRPKHLKK